MQKYLVLLSFLVIFENAFSLGNGKITGKITTADGHPAESITIGLLGTSIGGVTDQTGSFFLEAPAGEYTMVVYSMACHKKQIEINVVEDSENHIPDITVVENKVNLDEIVVTGQFSPQSVRNSVYKVKVINQTQIEAKGATTIQSILNTDVGIRMSNDMALGETDFELMGMSGNNVKVLIDGVPMLDRLDKKQSLSQIDINQVERIEIIEGPMSVIYGSDALAGVINIITKKNGGTGKTPWNLSARIQEESVGDEYQLLTGEGLHNQSLAGGYNWKNGLFTQGSFTHNEFGGWQGSFTGRKKEWQPKNQFLAGGQLGLGTEIITTWYRLDYLNEVILNQGDVNILTNKTFDKEYIVDRFTHQLQADWRVASKFKLSEALSYQHYNRKTLTTNIDLNTGDETLALDAGAQDETYFESIFARTLGVWSASQKLSLQPGIEYQSTKGEGDRINGEQQVSNLALFLSAEYTPIQWFQIRPGVRSNYNSVFDAPKVVPAVNVKLNLSNAFDLRLSYGAGYRAPTLQELFYSFHDSNHNINGNPNLEAEHSDSYMLSLVYRSMHNEERRLTHTFSAFYNDFSNKIDLIEKADQPGYNYYYNINVFKTTGFTLENNFSTKKLTCGVNFSYIGRYNNYYNDVTFSEMDMEMFRFSPELTASGSYTFREIGTFSLFYKFTGKREEYMLNSADEIYLQGLESYQWADLSFQRNLFKNATLTCGVKNIFDVTMVSSTAAGSSGAHSSGAGNLIGSGRSYFVGLSLNL